MSDEQSQILSKLIHDIMTNFYLPALQNDIREEISKKVAIINSNNRVIQLPEHGSVTITCHDGQIKYIETTTKEKV